MIQPTYRPQSTAETVDGDIEAHGEFAASVKLKVDNPKLKSCMEAELSRMFHAFHHGEWTFVVNGRHEMPPIVDQSFFEMSVRTGSHAASAMCDGGPAKITVKASVKSGARSVNVITKDGGSEFRRCFESMVSDIVTKSVLRPNDSDETLASDADAETTYTFEP